MIKLIADLGMKFPNSTSKRKRRAGLYNCSGCGRDVEMRIAYGVDTREFCEHCSRKVSRPKHNMSNTKEYRAWSSMKDRCNNPKNKKYPLYGAIGISVCNRWMESFENFFEDMGLSPDKKMSIDRRENKNNYEPSNCRWATAESQNQNRGIPKNNKTGYKGVVKTPAGRYRCVITANGQVIRLGTHSTPEAAALAYNKYVDDNKLEHCKNEIK